MRTIAAAVTLVTVFVLTVAAQQTSDKPVVLKVSGMSCSACAKTVEKEAKKIEGVKTVKVSHPKGEAEITYDPEKTSAEAIAKKISEKTSFKAEAPKKAQKD
jgi:copper chaperone CopZ